MGEGIDSLQLWREWTRNSNFRLFLLSVDTKFG